MLGESLVATGTAGPLTSYPQPCLRPQHFPLLRPGCHSELGRVPSGDHSAPAAPGHLWRSPNHTTALPALLPAGACNLGTRVHTARPAGLQNEEPVWQMVLPEASTSSCTGGLAHHGHVGRLLARWLPWVPGKLLVTAMSSWEHGHQVAGERITRGTCCGQSVVIELVLGLWGPLSGTQALRVHLVSLSRPFGGLPE